MNNLAQEVPSFTMLTVNQQAGYTISISVIESVDRLYTCTRMSFVVRCVKDKVKTVTVPSMYI